MPTMPSGKASSRHRARSSTDLCRGVTAVSSCCKSLFAAVPAPTMPAWPLISRFSCSPRLSWRAVPWCLDRWTTARLTGRPTQPRSTRRRHHPGSNTLDCRLLRAMFGSTVTGTGAVPAISGCRDAGRLSTRTRPGGPSSGSAKTSPGDRMAANGKSAVRRRKPGRASKKPSGAGATSRVGPDSRRRRRHGSNLSRIALHHRSYSRPSRAGPASCAGWPSGLRPSAPIRHPGPPRLARVIPPSRVGVADAGGRKMAKRPTGIDGYYEKIAVAGQFPRI